MIDLMPTRQRQLEATLEAWRETGIPLVQKLGGYGPAGYSDDPGLYLVVPWLARNLGISVGSAADLFFLSVIVAASVSGLVGLWMWSRERPTRIYGALVIAGLALAAFRVGDVYIMAFAMSAGFVPWLLYSTRDGKWHRALLLLLPVLGLASAASHLIRSHSATPVLLFAIVLLLTTRAPLPRKAASLGLVLVGLLIVTAGMSQLTERRDAYLATVAEDYDPLTRAHPFWHTVYIGLGYTENPYVAEYRDPVGRDRAEKIEPGVGYLSTRYEEILRDETLRLALEHPGLIVTNVLVKLGVSLAWGLLFFNIGLLALLKRRPPPRITGAFLAAAAFSILPGLIAVPRPDYLLGFFSFTALFAVAAVASAFTRPPAGDATGT